MRARSRRRKARPDSGGSPSGAGLSVPCEPDSGSTSPLRLLERAALQMVEAEQPQRTQVPDFDTAIDIQRWVSNATDVVPSARKDIYLPTALKSSAFAAHVEALPDCDDVHQPRFPLTHAVLDPDGSDVAIVGSCDKTSQTHVVVAVSTEHKRQRRPDPLIFGVGLCPDYVQDLHWVPGSRQVVVAHNFQASVFTVSDRFAIDFQTSLTLAHTDEIREMAFCPSAPNLFASGGFDRILCAHDLNIGTRCTTASVRIDEIIGSVSWDRTDVHGVAITTDDGRFMMYDTRVKLRRPTMCVDSQKVQLYTHTWCNAHDVLLGFGDGTIQHTDLRTCRFLHDIRDPHVAAIDRLAVHGQSRTLLVSGYSDYTLWTLNNIDNRMSAR